MNKINYKNVDITNACCGEYGVWKEGCKTNAKKIKGLYFYHIFLFRYCKESEDNDYVNGRSVYIDKEEQSFHAFVNGGFISSKDLKSFVFYSYERKFLNDGILIPINKLKSFKNEKTT